MTIQTAVLIETLVALGADVRWSSCNIFSTQDHAAAAWWSGPRAPPKTRAASPSTPGRARRSRSTGGAPSRCSTGHTTEEEADGPNMILDDGGDTTLLVHKGTEYEKAGAVPDPERRLRGGGRDPDALPRSWPRTRALDRIGQGIIGVPRRPRPACTVCIRSSKTGAAVPRDQRQRLGDESKFDNLYGCRHSLIDGINRATDVMIGGKVAVIWATATSARAAPIAARPGRTRDHHRDRPDCALQAAMEGFEVTTLEDVGDTADIFITATGNKDIIRAEHMEKMKHQAIVGNIGHFDNEIDMAGLEQDRRGGAGEHQATGRRVGLRGRPLDHRPVRRPAVQPRECDRSSELRDVQLASPTRRWPRWSSSAGGTYEKQVYALPKRLDEKVDSLRLDTLGVKLTSSPRPGRDLGVAVEGPYKSDHYRY